MSRTIGALILSATLLSACGTSGSPRAEPRGTEPPSRAASPTVLPPTAPASTPSLAVPTLRPTATPGRSSSQAPAPPTEAAESLEAEVSIQGFRFVPQQLQVQAGTTVVWTNSDQAGHTVTAGPADEPDGRFDSGVLGQDQSFEQRFDESGTYAYFCNLHPRMTGEIEVMP